MKYQCVRFREPGRPQVLSVESVELRRPVGKEVLVKVRAIGVTQGDAMYRCGTYLERPEFPSGIGTEMCGIVEACGEDVIGFAASDRVSSISSASINRYPAYGEYALFPQTSLVHTPQGLSDREGAAYALGYFPMYFALIRECLLQVGQWVLLNAAAATTSIAACQIARLAGARVIGLVRDERKLRELADVGFDHILIDNPRTPEAILDITRGGANVVLDAVGGAGAATLAALARRRGRILHYGALAGDPAVTHSLYHIVPKFVSVSGFTIYGYTGSEIMKLPRDERAIAEAAAFIAFGVESGHLRPKIARTLPLQQVVEAHETLASGRHVGKIVLTT